MIALYFGTTGHFIAFEFVVNMATFRGDYDYDDCSVVHWTIEGNQDPNDVFHRHQILYSE